MQQFKDGQRRNDLNSIMRDIRGRMSADDVAAVAYYMAGLNQ
jgi:cytochrome c553